MYHVGPCPICREGLRGVRVCCGRPIILCDECDAIWSSPDEQDRFSSTVDPRCEFCRQSLWGGQARWASREETVAAGWWLHIAGEQGASSSAESTARDEAIGPQIVSRNHPERPVVIDRRRLLMTLGLLIIGGAVAILALW